MSDARYWIGFNRITGIGPVRLRALLDHFQDDLEAAWKADAWALARSGLDQRAIERIIQSRREIDLDREMARLAHHGVTARTWADDSYPRLLREIPQPPPVIYIRGELLLEDEWAIAVVGTRQITPYGRQATETLVEGFASAGLTVVSGLALGVDRVAHEAALRAGGRTIAVLANGVEQVYPRSNLKLAESIVREKRGALISDYPIGTRPEPSNFPPRNRIISGLALATIVVEAGARSGALITSEFAAEQGREVFAVPGSIFSAASLGTNELIRQGAVPALSAQSVLQALNVEMAEPQKVVRQIVETTPGEAKLLTHLSSAPVHIDDLGRQCALAPAEVSSTLALLELKGLVRQVGAMTYVKV